MVATLNVAPWRGLYTAGNGDLYGCAGQAVYFIDPYFNFHQLGQIVLEHTPVSMADNGDTLVLVDGSPNGYTVDLATKTFGQITDPNFLGADKVDILDGFLLFNQPGTINFYSSLDNEVAFDPLFFAGKNTYSDTLITIFVLHREIWLLGRYKSEVWYNAGNPLFPFAELPGAHIEYGCAAKYSVASVELSIFWVGQNISGHGVIMRGRGYQATRISNHAVENEIQKYPTLDDAVGFCYQQNGHNFYIVNFPSGNTTWGFDDTTELWHKRAWKDVEGALHRHRAQVHAHAYGIDLVGDWENGNLYEMDTDIYTDNGMPIQRIRGFPHSALISGAGAQRIPGFDEGKRISFTRFSADIEVGTQLAGSSTPNPPTIDLRWSDSRGASWGNPLRQLLGAGGQYLAQPQWQRLGLARDRVFELSWDADAKVALNSAWVDAKPLRT